MSTRRLYPAAMRDIFQYLVDNPAAENPYDSRNAKKHRSKRQATALALWESSCPRVFPIWLCSGTIPGAVAYANGVFDFATCLLCTLLCFALLTLVCLEDDYGDLKKGVDGDTRIGAQKPLQRGELTVKQMRHAIVGATIVVVAISLSLMAYAGFRNGFNVSSVFVYVAIAVVSIVAAFCYTIPKHAYGYVGLGDFIGWLFFGPVAGMGGYYLYAYTMDPAVFFPASSAGLLLAGSINLANIRDIENDLAFGKYTFAARLGARKAFIYQCLLMLGVVGGFIAFNVIHGIGEPVRYVFLVAVVPLVMHLVELKRVVDTGDFEHIRMMMLPYMVAYLAISVLFCMCITL